MSEHMPDDLSEDIARFVARLSEYETRGSLHLTHQFVGAVLFSVYVFVSTLVNG